MPDTPPLVSVVVPTYGRPRLLHDCVDGILAQTCTFPFEVVVIDDGGAPSAEETLSPFSADPRLKITRQANGGPAKARNEGIRRSLGTYVAFIDDDCAPEPGWLQAAIDAFEDDVIVVHGPVAPPRPASPLAYHFIDTGNQPANVTANLVVRRDVLLSVGGFDEGFPYAAGEDFDLCWRLEMRGESRFAANARVIHALIPLTWQKRRSRPRQFATYFRLYALHPDRLKDTGLPGLTWARPALLRHSPPLWIGTYVTLMPLLQWIRMAPQTDWRSALPDLAATCANIPDAFRFAREYLATYQAARDGGAQPGLRSSSGSGTPST